MHTDARRIVVAVNPSASFGGRRRVGAGVVATLRASGHDVVPLEAVDGPTLDAAVRAALDTAPDALVVVGGDGMVSLAINALDGRDVPLGIVPTGTGNDTARALGLPLDDPDAAVRLLLAALAAPRRVDLIRATGPHLVGSRLVVGAVSAGVDALINDRANRMRRPRGASRYTIALLVELARLRPRRVELALDGRDASTDAVLACVANGTSIGGGMRVTPHARLDDGLLDVMTVAPLGRLRFLRLFPSVFRGEHVGFDVVRIERAARVRIGGEPVVAYGDGERIAPLPLDLVCEPAALAVLAPPAS
jgi:diacylglycerol kinase (ATP)